MTSLREQPERGRRVRHRRSGWLSLRAGQAARPVADPRCSSLACWLVPGRSRGRRQRRARCRPTPSSAAGWARPAGPARWSCCPSACSWVLPLLTSLVAGDVFAAEDRLGTWRHLLIVVRSPRRVFAAKALASLTVHRCCWWSAWPSPAPSAGWPPSAPAAGRPGRAPARRPVRRPPRCCSPGPAVLAPTLAFAAVGLLGRSRSAARRWAAGARRCWPSCCSWSQLLPLPVAVRLALPSWPSSPGAACSPPRSQTGSAPHRRSSSASPGRWSPPRWPTCCSCAATSPTRPTTAPAARARPGRCCRWPRCSRSPSASSPPPARQRSRHRPAEAGASLATAYAHLYRLQTAELHRPAVTEAQLRTTRDLRQGRPPGRRRRSRQRLALRRVLAPPGHQPPSARRSTSSTSPRRPLRRRRRRAAGGQRLLHRAHPDRGRTQPPLAVRRPLSTCSPHLEGLGHMQVTRQRRTAGQLAPAPPLTGRRVASSPPAPSPSPSPAAGIAYASTTLFGHHQVGTQYADGLQVSDDQVRQAARRPPGHQVRQVHGLDAQPGRAVPRRDQHRQERRAADVRPVDLQAHLDRRHGDAASTRSSADGTVGQEGPTWSPDGKVLWLPQSDGLTRFPVNADGTLGAPTTVKLATVGTAAALPGKAVYSADGTTLYVPVNGQNTRRRARPGHRRGAADAGRSGSPRASWPSSAPSSTSATRAAARPSRARPPSTPTAPRCRPTPTSAPRRPARQRHRHRRRRPPRSGRSPSGCTRPPCTSPGKALFVANTNSDTVSVINTANNKVVQTIATQPWPSSDGRLRADRHRADQGRPPAGHPRPGQRGRGLPLRRHTRRSR